jgi:hypothetical protein
MLTALFPLLISGSHEKYLSAMQFMRTDFILTLALIALDHLPHSFAFRKYYYNRAPHVKTNMLLIALQFVLVTMNISEIY